MNTNRPKQRKGWKKFLRFLLLLLPFFIGFIGFLRLEGISVLWAAYYAIRLYGLNTDIYDINLFVEIARWLAPIATASAILTVLHGACNRFRDWTRSFFEESCSVYGEDPDGELFLANLGKNGIHGNFEKPLKSRIHVVFGESDQKSLDFYSQNSELFKNYRICFPWSRNSNREYQIFLSLNEISHLALQQKNVAAFSVTENCATVYWRNHPASCSAKIALIGSGMLCEALLSESLFVNILSPHQSIEYHVWADISNYLSTHRELRKMLEMTRDQLHIHEIPWQSECEMLTSMDRIVLCDNEEKNLSIAANLIAYQTCSNIHIYSRKGATIQALFPQEENMVVFGSSEELLTRQIIIKEQLLLEAKKIHCDYQKRYPGLADWSELDAFKRHSNVSAAHYFPVIRRLYKQGVSVELLTELEHIRWCRFHYFYNWKFSDEKNNLLRTHPCLIPFSELSEGEQDKDRENVLMAIQ